MPLGKEVGLGPGHTVLDGDIALAAPPHFRAMPIVAKRSPISATAELLFMHDSAIDLEEIVICWYRTKVRLTVAYKERRVGLH